jgi:hypothetical protein
MPAHFTLVCLSGSHCILIPTLFFSISFTPAFRHSHQVHPDIRAMWIAQPLHRVHPLQQNFCARWLFLLRLRSLRRRFLTAAAIYLSLAIIAPLCAFRAPPFSVVFRTHFYCHILALVGVIYVADFNKSTRRLNVAPQGRCPQTEGVRELGVWQYGESGAVFRPQYAVCYNRTSAAYLPVRRYMSTTIKARVGDLKGMGAWVRELILATTLASSAGIHWQVAPALR